MVNHHFSPPFERICFYFSRHRTGKSKAKKTPPPQRSEFYWALSGGLKHGTGHAFHGAEESLLGEIKKKKGKDIVADSFAVSHFIGGKIQVPGKHIGKLSKNGWLEDHPFRI